VPAEPKDRLLSALARQGDPGDPRLIAQMVTHPRGRALPVALDMCASIAGAAPAAADRSGPFGESS
jgi:hypothetical protein